MWAVWMALLLWAVPIQGVSTKCEIPAVEKLQNTSLTCTFSEDISKRKQDFEVHFYKNNATDSSETILRCYWMDNKLECRVHSCCEYDGHVTANLTVRVLSVTDARVGRYVCFVLPAAPDGNNFCNFTLRVTEKITDTSANNLAALAALVVIPLIICIITIIIVWRRKCDDDTHTTRETSHILDGNEFQTENEAKDQKTLKSDVYNHTTNIERRKAKSIRKLAQQKEKGAQVKAEKDEKINDEAEIEIKSAREKAEKEEKIVKENAEKEEATAERKAEELEKIAKEKAEIEERMADDKAKEQEKITKDKAEEAEFLAKLASMLKFNTPANIIIEEQFKNISNEKEKQMTKIAKRKDKQMEIIAKEKDEQLEKIAKEKREELEKIAIAREKQLEEISKRKTEEIDKIKKRKEEEINKIKYVKKGRMERIRNKKEKEMETIYKKKEEKRKKKGKENKHTEVRESLEVQGSDEQSKEKENEDDVCRVEVANESDSLLNTTISNDQVNPATRSKSTNDTVFTMSELASLQEISEALTGTQGQTLQAVDKVGNPVKKNNEDIESNGRTTRYSECAVS